MYFRKKFDSRSIKSLLHAFGIKSTYFIKKKNTFENAQNVKLYITEIDRDCITKIKSAKIVLKYKFPLDILLVQLSLEFMERAGKLFILIIPIIK